jgi:peroxiredoxin Q/BCP
MTKPKRPASEPKARKPAKTAALAVGKKVPDFALPATRDQTVRLKGLGQPVVLYFYPKDDTSGCTAEGLDFKAHHAAFRRAGAVVLGVSRDPLPKHDRFRAKHGFPFDLLCDEDGALCAAFGVWVEKSLYGRKYMGIERSTFLVGADRTLLAEWRKVKVAGHAEEVLAAVREHAEPPRRTRQGARPR